MVNANICKTLRPEQGTCSALLSLSTGIRELHGCDL